MDERDTLAERFEAARPHLSRVAYRMLGSLSEAEDAVQETWLRLSRADASAVENLTAWLTTVTARVCLDVLRGRKARREEAIGATAPEPRARRDSGGDPEREALVADSVGLALLVVLETLPPAERLAFVLHDMFAVPFDDIARIVEKTPAAARQLASRGRRKVQGGRPVLTPDRARQREIVDAFLTAARAGDFTALLSVLDPDVVLRMDHLPLGAGPAAEMHGAEAIARRAILTGARAARPAWVDHEVGAVVAPAGHLLLVLKFTIADGRITAIDAVSDAARLRRIELAVLPPA